VGGVLAARRQSAALPLFGACAAHMPQLWRSSFGCLFVQRTCVRCGAVCLLFFWWLGCVAVVLAGGELLETLLLLKSDTLPLTDTVRRIPPPSPSFDIYQPYDRLTELNAS
jgi:hypothetical protein